MKRSTLGSCIRALRLQHDLTQARLADILGVTDKAVSKWERDLSYPEDDLLRECRGECRPSKLMQAFEVSRDIRTPLHIILGLVEIIRNNHDDPELLQRYLDGIAVSGEYMMTLLDRVQKERCRCGDRDRCGEEYPLTQEELERYLQERISAGQQQTQSVRFTGRRILVAEDLAINREIAAEVLKQTGAMTECAENGRVCLEKVQAAPAGYYDLILMDVMMPEMDGLETTRRIRELEDPGKANIPIIALTTNVSEKDRSAALAAGMNAFAEKPIFVDSLFETMRECMEQA